MISESTLESVRRILRRPAVTAATGIPPSTLYRLIRDGRFPRPIPLGSRSVGWLQSEIDDWLERQGALREVAS